MRLTRIRKLLFCSFTIAFTVLAILAMGQSTLSRGFNQDLEKISQLISIDSIGAAEIVIDSMSKRLIYQSDSLKITTGFELAKRYRQIHRYKSAADIYEILVQSSRKLQDSLNLSRGLYYLGLSYKKLGFLNKASNVLYDGLTVTQSTNDLKRQCLILIQIGIVNKTLEQYEKASSVFVDALHLAETLNEEGLRAAILNNLGSVYKQQGNFTYAREHYLKAIEINKQLANERNLSYNYNNLANVFEAMGDLNRALVYQKESIEIKRKIEDQPMLAMSYANLSILLQKMGEKSDAEHYAKMALDLALKYSNAASISAAHLQLIEIQKEKGDFESALKLKESLSDFKDSLRTLEREALIKENEAQFERQSMLSTMAYRNRGTKNTTAIRFSKASVIAFFIGMSFAILILFFMFYRAIIDSSRKSSRVHALETEVSSLRKLNKMQNARLEEVSGKLKILESSFEIINEGLTIDLRKDAEALQSSAAIGEGTEKQNSLRKLIATKLLRRIDALQDIVDSSFNRFSINHQSYVLSDVIESIQGNLMSVLKSKDIEFVTNYPNSGEILVGDKRRIEQVLTNVIEHAVAYTNAQFIEIVVATKHGANGQALLSVTVVSPRHTLDISVLDDPSISNEPLATEDIDTKGKRVDFSLIAARKVLGYLGGNLWFEAGENDEIIYAITIDQSFVASSSE